MRKLSDSMGLGSGDRFGLEFGFWRERLRRSYYAGDAVVDFAGCVGPFGIEGPSCECRLSGFLFIVGEFATGCFNVHS